MKVDNRLMQITIVKVSSLNPLVNINVVTRTHRWALLDGSSRGSVALVSPCYSRLMGVLHVSLLKLEGELYVNVLSLPGCPALAIMAADTKRALQGGHLDF